VYINFASITVLNRKLQPTNNYEDIRTVLKWFLFKKKRNL